MATRKGGRNVDNNTDVVKGPKIPPAFPKESVEMKVDEPAPTLHQETNTRQVSYKLNTTLPLQASCLRSVVMLRMPPSQEFPRAANRQSPKRELK